MVKQLNFTRIKLRFGPVDESLEIGILRKQLGGSRMFWSEAKSTRDGDDAEHDDDEDILEYVQKTP